MKSCIFNSQFGEVYILQNIKNLIKDWTDDWTKKITADIENKYWMSFDPLIL
jgi:hypothetical protein